MNSQGLHQTQRQAQGIALTPQLRQSLHILQIPSTELNHEVTLELAANPLLEELPPGEIVTELLSTEPLVENTSLSDFSIDDDAGADPLEIPPRPAKRDDALNDDYNDVLQKIENDWRDRIRDDSRTLLPHTQEDDERRQFIFDSATNSESLDEHLLKQARLAAPSPQVLQALHVLIGELDERGFMTTDLGSLCLKTSLPRLALEEAWEILKTFSPFGIGAADLRECFLIQLSQSDRQHTLAALIIEKCFPLLLKRRFSEIVRILQTTHSKVDAALAELARLQTSPSKNFGHNDNFVLFPDITVRRTTAPPGWEVEMTRAHIPRLRLNQSYKSLLAAKTLKPEDRDYIKEKMRSGSFLISAIEQRQNTLENVARLILKHQADFFENGPSRLHPLTMAVIAAELNIHETTVSRAIANKSILTPHGIFELRYFFTSGVTTDSGDTLSNVSIRSMLADIIASENSTSPLGDRELVIRLRQRGVNVARRTVARYRELMNIPPSHLRKRR
ncbi:MAG: RNA polymerase factor sigma-54 [Puniceicoccales bacterium]|jgi:RNA polymerase sigma-54 factor|nr:RNA polymerase factor sigma-54 [Puniceicoccales bacterium]